MANAYELMQNLAKENSAESLSRLFIYYNSRLLEGTTNEDAGASLRDSLAAASKYGICTEDLWPYDIKKFNARPTDACYQDGLTRRITNYRGVNDIEQAVDALNNRRPVVFGVTVFPGFQYVDKFNPVVTLSGNSEEDSGGHAMCMVGYDRNRRMLLAKNSFGTDWGDQGYCWFTYDYIDQYGYDMWVFDIPAN